jgi:ubiquinol-cytochrome c reductase iron-sulfur subunit
MFDDGAAVNPELPPDPSRRFWVTTACAMGGVAGVAITVPLVRTFSPSDKARAAGAPVEVEVGDIPVGTMRVVEWRGKPVWIMHRSAAQIAGLKTQDSLLADPNSKRPGFTPKYAENEGRSRKPELFVCVGICTHLGCSPTPRFETGAGAGMGDGWQGGFLCPCHGSTFDLAGRVYKNKPAPDNLEVPPYEYLTETRIVVGVDENNLA